MHLIIPKETQNELDLALLFGMERTLFSALNVGLIMHLFGVGMWMADINDTTIHVLGGCMIAASAIVVAFSYALYFVRFKQWKEHNPQSGYASVYWTGLICLLLFITLIVEIVYAIVYPYLNRSIPVTVENI
ncbi:hypothetical protein TetV_487 [Tetraselmis virus 1]|uniref:DUF202 domain-containing protein n=1 Tax=Tetraselmis virus 1 TaxID=2060617 RepID=A0A2P0VP68_9VIRU|nr:hypothetical protein QJ968_gp567 [Tetraselmis virus 1]AUF82569.1 hypothetical protein TetV_487 [Tetraselmis virus 1]